MVNLRVRCSCYVLTTLKVSAETQRLLPTHRRCYRWFFLVSIRENTPWKIKMEPTNHPFPKENDLPKLHDYVPS